MKNLKPFTPKNLFKDENRIIINGRFEPWTLGSKTKLKAGGKIDMPKNRKHVDGFYWLCMI